ncbi:DUF4190 domain-containing protein [Bacillus sp. AK031]
MEEKTNGKAITSLLLGTLSIITPYIGLFLGVVGIAGAVTALQEFKKSRKNHTYQKGESLAVIGIIISVFGCL